MPQPIAVGAVLGGRYRITQHVVTSADQDMVFLGTDQVLNRRVTVLVASRENATQVASSARELATGERNDDVQVLDLGLSEGRTYLIAGGDPDPDVLLGLAYPQELYVEPFQTDSLGSELFGESRTGDPHAYDDDEAYYTDLDRRLRADEDEAQRRPGFLNRLSERLAERVRPSDGTAAKAAAGASALAAADAATRKQQEERERAEREAAERAERERKEAEEKARAEREAAERAERERKEAAERAERERREAEERAEEERRAEAERARRQAEQEAEERAAREREAEQARLAAEREEAERRELERRAEARRRAEEERAREAERREAEKREAQEREAAEREAQEREAAEREAQAGTAALPAVAAGAAAAQATDADADGATPPTEPVEPVESVAAEKTDPPEPVAPDTEAIPVRRQRPVPRRAIVAESAPPVHEESRSTAAPVAAGTATGATAAAAGSTSAAAAPDALAAPATTGGDDGATVADPGDGNGRTRGGGPLALLLVLGLLAALVVGGVLLAQNLRGGPAPQAAAASSESASSESASDTPSPSESTSPSPTPTSESAAAAPQPVQALRSVPDLPEHEAEHDADLSNLIDGDPTTVWRTFAYARPNFGGYVESMNLVVQLEERTEVNEVTLQSTGATGGAWFAYIADSPEGANAKEIGNGTFDQDTVSIPVPFEGTEAEAEYVIVSLTSLPQLEGTTSDLPFGLRLGEIAVR
ncbi:hypothetical protein O3677_10440 [Micrococcus luteus]|uniref:hypothetical protein n=2 Tax=Micrococcaceae TaxID=1268 RepID=UPI000EFD0EB5|nr:MULTISPECIES: hypothetical protein [Micrococcus]MCK1800330.1 hypothetical protein [Micrococcus sp. XM4230B]MCK1812029.1 hypothetical protein [Micrococcus sp. XM4230A]AYO50644.1 hypothetical protein FMM_09885 [Micrococcus luteus]MBO1029033.1 hypothetical protein [Micrococcus luteus]MBY0170488.1 hypothetical protein [Micrococcus luteus]